MADFIATEISKMGLKSEEPQKNPIDIVKSGNLEDLKNLLKIEVDVNSEDDSGNTLLHLACINGHFDIFNLLLDHGGNIRSKNNICNTPLHEAAKSGNIDIIRIFLNKKININARNKDDETPIHFACLYGHLPVVIELVNKSADIYIGNITNEIPLHYAIQKGHIDIMNYFLNGKFFLFQFYLPFLLHYAIKYKKHKIINVLINQYNLDINGKDKNNDTPLHFAARVGDSKIIAFLLKKGAQISSLNKFNKTPMHEAIENGQVVAVEELLLSNHSFSDDYLIYAAGCGDKNVLQVLLEFGVNSQCDKALMNAVNHNNTDIVEILCIRIRKSDSTTNLDDALSKAVKLNSVKNVQILLRNGANVNCNSLLYAVEHNDIEMVEILSNIFGTSTNKQNGYSHSRALSKAVEIQSVTSVKILLKNGASASKENLLHAVEHNYTEIVELLSNVFAKLENQKELNAALFKAIQKESVACVRILLSNGANTNHIEYACMEEYDIDLQCPTTHLLKNCRNVAIRNLFKN